MKKTLYFLCLYVIFIGNCIGYNTLTEFLESPNADACVLASDGCNTFILKDKQLYGGSSLSCGSYERKWQCEWYKQDPSLIERFIDIEEIEEKRQEIQQSTQKREQSINADYTPPPQDNRIKEKKEQSLENILKKELGSKYLRAANQFIKKYRNITGSYSQEIQVSIHKKVLQRLNKKITTVSSKKWQSLLKYIHLKITELL